MAFTISPGITVVETDLTNIVPAVSTTIGATVISSQWGPVLERTQIASENELVTRFGPPNNDVFADFFSAANYLSYTNNLWLVRVVGALAKNAVVGAAASGTVTFVKNSTHYDTITFTDQLVVAKYPGVLGNSLKVHMMDSTKFLQWKYYKQFDRAPATSEYVSNRGGSLDELHVIVIDEDGLWTGTQGTILEKFAFVSKAIDAKKSDGTSNYVKDVLNRESKYVWMGDPTEIDALVGSISSTTFSTTMSALNDSDEVVSVTIAGSGSGFTQDGTTVTFTGGGGSGAAGTATIAGGTVTAVTMTNRGTGYTSAPTVAFVCTGSTTGTLAGTAVLGEKGKGGSLTQGVDANTSGITDAVREAGWDLFANAEEVDVTLLISGPASNIVKAYIKDNVADTRKDCMLYVSPLQTDVVNNSGGEYDDIITTASAIGSSSYVFMDNNWKYQYDRYNDTFRWLPLNPDIAGLSARTDLTNDAWWSPAGLNRGIIKNCIKLAWSATSAQRDALYQANVNSIVTMPGIGTILYGDKTRLTKPSAFDRINVRRLFIVLEKAISIAAKYQLFEFNDAFTRAQFKSMVEPYLRDIQGRRGITDFRVVCDTTNNTAQVIDSNQFVGTIFIKPNRVINFIQLNFVATRSGVSFSEIGA